MNDIKKPRGRPRVDSQAVLVRIPSVVLGGIDGYVEKSGEPIGRPEAIRRILTDFLKRRGYLGK